MSPTSTPQFHTVLDISKERKLDRHKVTAVFLNEPGVENWGTSETVRGRRRYAQLRIPHHVYVRVMARFANAKRGRR